MIVCNQAVDSLMHEDYVLPIYQYMYCEDNQDKTKDVLQ